MAVIPPTTDSPSPDSLLPEGPALEDIFVEGGEFNGILVDFVAAENESPPLAD